MAVHPHAGKLPAPETLENIPALVSAYYTESPDPHQAAQRVSFGTSGHRGSSLKQTFNERHIHAITQAVCDYRKQHGITGPLFMGGDTHALSEPAFRSALEVLTANDVQVPRLPRRFRHSDPCGLPCHPVLEQRARRSGSG